MNKKIRITMEEVLEDGTVQPVFREDGNPVVFEREGAVVLSIDRMKEGVEASCAILNTDSDAIQAAMAGDEHLKKCALRVAAESAIGNMMQFLCGGGEETQEE